MPQPSENMSIQIAIAWCIAWGTNTEPGHPIETFNRWRTILSQGETPTDPAWQSAFAEASALTERFKPGTYPTLPELTDFISQHPTLWSSPIGLIYGGVTKVKSYVFESADLQEIRGASALLDRINLIDLPALFHAETSAPSQDVGQDANRFQLCQQAPHYCKLVREAAFQGTTSIADALIPELIVYATGGKILAFCPAAFTSQLCNAIEKRYTSETLTANSCAVGAAFRPLEIYSGLLKDPIEETLWHDAIAAQHTENIALQAYFGFQKGDSAEALKSAFENRKNFGEVVGKLTGQFNQRRSSDDSLAALPNALGQPSDHSVRPSRRYPPMFETHPYLMRDDSDIRSTAVQISADVLPDSPKFSEPTARKRRVGQLTKRESASDKWYKKCGLEAHWNPTPTREAVLKSWINKFESYLENNNKIDVYDPHRTIFDEQDEVTDDFKREARSLHEIGASSNGYVGYIYADGNSMGQYIRNQIKTPAQYQKFSADIFEATAESVYCAIADHITPYHYKPDAKSSRKNKDKVWIHPFEIVTIGGDDVLLIVPANKAIEIAQSIGQYFEQILVAKGGYDLPTQSAPIDQSKFHRYKPASAPVAKCCLSTSSGVLITAENTPIYYADKLVSQLLKSAKQHLKTLDKRTPNGYHGGTVDFLVLKAVTMISSNIAAFRQEGLTIPPPPPDPERSSDLPPQREYALKLYAAPYTLYELGGLINTVKAIKQSGFPKSQLYQIRSLLERGKRTAILNYRYFRVRLAPDKRAFLENQFEQGWCNAGTNGGNIAPWLTVQKDDDPEENKKTNKSKESEKRRTVYETIWREMVELEPFLDENADTANGASDSSSASGNQISPQLQQPSQGSSS